ncbi:MAG: chemotaxis response regulator protein-glutamate methylesterase [Nitrospirota bacterium]
MGKKIRVMVIDDSAFYREAIANMLKQSPYIDVVGRAVDGSEGIKLISKLNPDVITLDLEMPNINGFGVLRWIMKNRPLPVIIISSINDGTNTFKALEIGASDFLAKPCKRATLDIMKVKNELINKIRAIAYIPKEKLHSRISSNSWGLDGKIIQKFHTKREADIKRLIAIGSSTGGPKALHSILTVLPKGFPAAIVISQHMPTGFTWHFAERLNNHSLINVKEADDGDKVEMGTAYISPGGFHMAFSNGNDIPGIKLTKTQKSDIYTPSIDIMMNSAAEIFKEKTIGIILTGMGSDGKEGMKKIKNNAGYTIAESKETAYINGMPNEAIKSGAVDKVLSLPKIVVDIIQKCM